MNDTITAAAHRTLASMPENVIPGSRPALMVTWSVKEPFGGMTAMCLKRASIFHEEGVPSAVVTFDPDPNYGSLRAGLVADGRLDPAVPIINLYEYYSVNVPGKPTLPITGTITSGPTWVTTGVVKRPEDASVFYKDYTVAGNKELRRREYFRPDGTLYLVDCTLEATGNPKKTQRVLQLFRRGRTPAAEFNSAAKLYRYWLSELLGDAETDVIVDSKYSAAFLWSWEHPLATKLFNFHSTHIAAGQDPQSGTISRAHVPIIDHRSSWDGLVFLTESQRSAFTQRLGDSGNTLVVSNPAEGPGFLPPRESRDLTKVVYAGRLVAGKNVNHIIDIVATVARTGQPVTLDIIGDGEKRAELEQQVIELGLEAIVTFQGHVPSIGTHLSTANILLLCSSYEGQSLAILEAQAHGCVPVAYDVDFGPRDVIEHGVTGYLVPFNDKAAAAGMVVRLLGDDTLSSSLSSRAFERAESFNEKAIFNRWQESLDLARKNRMTLSLLGLVKPSLECIRFLPDGRIALDVAWQKEHLEIEALELVMAPRSSGTHETTVTVQPVDVGAERASFLISRELMDSTRTEAPLDLRIALRSGSASVTVRLGVHGRPVALPYLTAYGNLSLK